MHKNAWPSCGLSEQHGRVEKTINPALQARRRKLRGARTAHRHLPMTPCPPHELIHLHEGTFSCVETWGTLDSRISLKAFCLVKNLVKYIIVPYPLNRDCDRNFLSHYHDHQLLDLSDKLGTVLSTLRWQSAWLFYSICKNLSRASQPAITPHWRHRTTWHNPVLRFKFPSLNPVWSVSHKAQKVFSKRKSSTTKKWTVFGQVDVNI